MPHPIPEDRVLGKVLSYLSCRQIQERPTTIRQVSKTVGLGVQRILGMLEKEGIEYILVPHGEKWTHGNLEILIVRLPEALTEEYLIDNELLHSSYETLFAEATALPKVEFLKVLEESPGDELDAEDLVDPYAKYRISDEQFEKMRKKLITYAELVKAAKERGYTEKAISRAVGGYKLRYVFPSEHWRPYLYGRTRYYHKEVLKHLAESDKSYKIPTTAQRKRRRRQIEQGEIQNPTLFTSRKELFEHQQTDRLKDYLIR